MGVAVIGIGGSFKFQCMDMVTNSAVVVMCVLMNDEMSSHV